MSPTRLLLFAALGLGGVLVFAGTASAAAPEPKKAPLKLPESKPAGTIRRRGPNRTVLLSDLPADCQGLYDAAFGPAGATGCADARDYAEELDRMYALYEAGDPFFELEQYDALARAYERAASSCSAAQYNEEQLINSWVECLSKLGLTPQDVWAGEA